MGVLFGAAVIPPILELLNTTFGFQGAPGAGPNALAAPQAALISAIAQGVLGGSLDWNLVGLGAAIGVVAIVIDAALSGAKRGSLPPLAVGMGMYLPMDVTLLVIVGAVTGHLYNRWASAQAEPAFAERMGVLTATGLIVGDSLFNIVFAAVVAATNDPEVFALDRFFGGKGFAAATPFGIALFAGIVGYAYWRMRRDASAPVSV